MTASSTGPRASHADRVIRLGALAVGIVLFAIALYYINFRTAIGTIAQLGVALPLALLFSGLWHLARTWAWAWCFPQPRTVSFARLARVRLAAEAFSYLTLRGIAGEPLKVVLLGDSIDSREATAAVALERVAYLIVTTWIVGVGSLLAIVGLPLSHTWFRVFRAFGIGAGVIALLTVLVISGRGSYFQSWIQRIDRWFGTSIGGGRVMRFAGAVERQMLELVRGNPVRLAILLVATIAAYACMALEAWVVLHAINPAISLNASLAVETFSRVASFASAFIPANLGALEASSLAAVAAVGAVSGGAALALARRLRGLFWAAVGLAIYPRRARGSDRSARRTHERADRTHPHTLLYFPYDASVLIPPSARLAGLPIAERVLRPARRAGYTRILIWLPDADRTHTSDAWIIRLAQSVSGVTIARSEEHWRALLSEVPSGEPMTVVGAGSVVSTALLASARDLPVGADAIRDVPAGTDYRISGVLRVTAEAAASPDSLSERLAARRAAERALPSGETVSSGHAHLALRIQTPSDLAAAEHTIRRASYKNTDAKLARFNRRMSLPISIALIPTPITANQLSVLLVAVGFYAAWLFSTGHNIAGVLGGFLSLAASILDGCDGEIARLKYQESALGCWIETFGDYSYYVAIFVGLTIGAVRQTGWDIFYWLGGMALAGLLLTFALLIYLRSRITAGQPEKLHDIARTRFRAAPSPWSRVVWRISFVATRAAMPYGIMGLALLDALPLVVILAAIGANIYWISLMVKLRHLLGTAEFGELVNS
ncbi:MAG: lysylphosphatidylglycerol synthase domain-containing protein [Vicinamibacterales bacterium]